MSNSKPTHLKPWLITSSKIIHATPWIEVVEDQCLAEGKTLAYTYTRRIDEGPMIIADTGVFLYDQYRRKLKPTNI